MHKSLPISLDNVKCPKILDFYIVKYAICTQKSDGGHKSNVNKPNGHTLLETPCSKSLELPNSARNAKRAKNCQKEPKTSIILNLAFKGPKLKI